MLSNKREHARLAGITRATLLLAGWLPFASHAVDALPASDALAGLLPGAVTRCQLPQAAPQADVVRSSFYVEAADHVRLALDVFKSASLDHGAKVPTLFTATRYWRARDGASLDAAQRRWIAAGYAVVNADVRGTGASFGQWYIPYSPQEARDVGMLANWIGRQSWSNGAVVMTGASYPGTTPLLAAAYGSPALKAIAPKFSDFDMYSDLLWPGGVAAEDLSVRWGRIVRSMDLNEPEPDHAVPPISAGVRSVDGPDGGALLTQAIEAHTMNPWSFESAPYETIFKDQPSSHMHGMSIDAGDVYTHDALIERSAIPIFGWDSWLDSGIAQGLLNRFMTLTNPQLTIIGAWTHGARANADVFALDAPLDPPSDLQDQWVFCYLDNYANDARDWLPTHRLIYFTMGENRWKSTDVWPLPTARPRRFFLDANQTLSGSAPKDGARDSYKVDFEATTAPDNRWATQAGTPRIDYGDRALADVRLLTYTSAPLDAKLEITGQPLVTLNVVSDHTDGNFIVYLEDVSPEGRVTYLTEGELRAIHRKLSTRSSPYKISYPYRTYAQRDAAPLVPGVPASLTFQMQATSVRLERGHRLRLSLAGADKGTFLAVPTDQHDVNVQVLRGGSLPSFIDVPEIP